jgi:DNA-directed RNA polymerase specialized sigma subunit
VTLTSEHRRRLRTIKRAIDDRPRAVFDATKAGASLREIAEVLGVGKSTVERVLAEAKATIEE